MYYQKVTKAEKEQKLNKITDWVNNMESSPMIIAWKEFLKLPFSEQIAIRKEWDEYYVRVRKESPVYFLFLEQKKAMEENNIARVIDLGKQAKEMRKNGDHITIAKPRPVDPEEYNHGDVYAYKEYKRMIKELRDDLNEPETEEEKSAWE